MAAPQTVAAKTLNIVWVFILDFRLRRAYSTEAL